MTSRSWSVVVALWVWLVPALALAEGVRAAVEVDETQARVGDVVTVEFVVSKPSLRGSLPTPEVPKSLEEAFDIGQCVGGTPMKSVTSINGRRTVSLSSRISCPLTARKAGSFKIAFSVPDGKTRVTSNTASVEVLPSDVEAGPLEDPTVEVPADSSEDVFLWVSTDKKRAYVGEQITFRLDVYEAVRFLDVSLRTSPTFEGFLSEELPLPELYTTAVGDRTFRVRPGIRRALFAQQSGEAEIGEAELLIARRKRRYSQPIQLDILPLPAEGQPAGFSANNVGRYQISAKVDRSEVQPGDPFTLTYTISGQGNIELVDPGDWPTIPGVRTYDPKVTTDRSRGDVVGGTRTYSFLVIPERPGTLTIPAHTLAYFDPEAEAYQTASTQPVEVVVGGDPNAVLPDADGVDQEAGSSVDDPLAPVMTLESVPRKLPRERWLNHERWVYGMLGVPLLLGLGMGGGWAWRRFGPDETSRSRAQIRTRRRARIEAAQATVDSGDGFHASVSALLQDVALEVAGPEGTGLPRPELLRLLERRDVDAEQRRRLEALLDQCDAARFGAGGTEADERHMLLDDALALVRSLGRSST